MSTYRRCLLVGVRLYVGNGFMVLMMVCNNVDNGTDNDDDGDWVMVMVMIVFM